jgi:hypothetical protein
MIGRRDYQDPEESARNGSEPELECSAGSDASWLDFEPKACKSLSTSAQKWEIFKPLLLEINSFNRQKILDNKWGLK